MFCFFVYFIPIYLYRTKPQRYALVFRQGAVAKLIQTKFWYKAIEAIVMFECIYMCVCVCTWTCVDLCVCGCVCVCVCVCVVVCVRVGGRKWILLWVRQNQLNKASLLKMGIGIVLHSIITGENIIKE